MNSIKKIVSDISELPPDIISETTILTARCGYDLNIENYKGMIEYTDSLIRIRTKTGQIHIIGKKLTVDYYTNDEMRINGSIDSILFK